MISRLIGLTYENIAKMANKIFNVPNHLKCQVCEIEEVLITTQEL